MQYKRLETRVAATLAEGEGAVMRAVLFFSLAAAVLDRIAAAVRSWLPASYLPQLIRTGADDIVMIEDDYRAKLELRFSEIKER